MNSQSFSQQLFYADQVRAFDHALIASGVDSLQLMKSAARFAFESLRHTWPDARRICVFCGSGNNAGDGYILAGLAASAGLQVSLIELAPSKLQGDALAAREFALQQAINPTQFVFKQSLPEADVMVDALLGTGTKGTPTLAFEEAIARINQSQLPVLSIDIPSGLNPNTGFAPSSVVKAHTTVSFVAHKSGCFTGGARAVCGSLLFTDLGLLEAKLATQTPVAEVLSVTDLLARRPVRSPLSHKGTHGHLLVVGGDQNYGGAVAMAAEAAMRAGVGKVTVATREEHRSLILSRCPEVMVVGVRNSAELELLASRATALVVGPGLGLSPWSEQLLQAALALPQPKVVDADALTLLATRFRPELGARDIATPHPGEAARLLDTQIATIERDRYSALNQLIMQLGCHLVLKGAGSLLAGPGELTRVCPYGNSGMASAGMGDVLSGLLGSLLAQGMDSHLALALGVCVHSLAADRLAANSGAVGLLATDLIPEIRAILNQPHMG